MRLVVGIFICKATRFALRLLGRGGTNLPGKLALKCCPDILAHLGKQVNTVVVTGTNGKTTSARMLEEAYKKADVKAFSNRSGANLLPGITAEFIGNASLFGKMRVQHAIIECDEAAFRHAAKYLDAKVILVTNVFRDQLDRFGEIANTISSIGAGISQSPNATLCINGDCPLLVFMVQNLNKPVCYFGAEDSFGQEGGGSMVEAMACPKCQTKLVYAYKTYGHLGAYACESCDFKRPKTQVSVVKLLSQTADNTTVEVKIGETISQTNINLPGIYNVYNAIGVLAVCSVLAMPISKMLEALAEFQGGFGRMEAMTVGKAKVRMILVKNPIGASQVFTYLAGMKEACKLVVCLNDRSGDGADVSWIWDIETEALLEMQEEIESIYCGGIRADELAVWLKYVGIREEKIQVEHNMDALLQTVAESELPVYMMPTYTAMLEMRGKLEKEYGLGRFWE